ARPSLRASAGGLRFRLPARRHRVRLDLSALRLARAVLHRRPARPADLVYPRQSEGIRSMARVAYRLDDLSPLDFSKLETICLSRRTDGDDELHLARYAGHVPDLFATGTAL